MVRWLSLGLAAACCLVLFRLGVTAARPLTLNANEGWNAYHAAGVIAGQPLYPSPPGLFLTNYPPLSFFAVAAVGAVTGHAMLAGRALSWLSFVVWAIALALTARRLGCTRDESLFAAALFAVTMLVFADYYVGVNDPQLLAHAVAAFAPSILLREPRTRRAVFVGALLFALSIFVKHNLVAIPLACVIWLLRYDRPSAVRLIAYGAILGVAGLAACIVAFGPGFLEHLSTPRPTPARWLATMGGEWMPRLAAPLVVMAMLAWRLPRDRHVMFAVTLAAVATAVGMLEFAAAGMYWNATLEAAWALSLPAAVALNRLPSIAGMTRSRVRAAIAIGCLAVPAAAVAGAASIHWASPRFWIDPRWSEAASSRREIEFLAAQPGPALCENLALCYWAGKPPEVDFFNVRERVRHNPAAAEPLVRMVEARKFRSVQLDREDYDLGPEFAAAMRKNYALHHSGRWGSLLLPR